MRNGVVVSRGYALPYSGYRGVSSRMMTPMAMPGPSGVDYSPVYNGPVFGRRPQYGDYGGLLVSDTSDFRGYGRRRRYGNRRGRAVKSVYHRAMKKCMRGKHGVTAFRACVRKAKKAAARSRR